MDSGRKDGFCPFCGTKYVTEEIIHKTVVNQNITNRIETAVIQNGDSFDMLYERFAAFEEIGDLQSMTEIVGQMQKIIRSAPPHGCAVRSELHCAVKRTMRIRTTASGAWRKKCVCRIL